MSTSAESPRAQVRLRDGSTALLRAVPYDDPVARALVARVQQEYVARYGGPDEAAVDPAEFVPPAGLFLVAEVGGVPAGCGAWRRHTEGDDPTVAEVKRVYVEPAFRRRGLAQVLVAALEDSARRAGYRSVVLNSGDRQPEAIALYEGLGYGPVAGYGIYAGGPGAVFLGKRLSGPADESEERAS
ncbi:GNAT superfamily N-acetyltransferase [Geodermatophilus bullaregiensis]|uniref:GNAT family N-acetyltransferase n=1 Tax=Geodermatophilus bullaregiensis TaxID=1564160 RepID=UPI001958D1B6|nr:GNAT family N-acetyltransferase [Geodermatophilus bullaregiensis]MBM7805515.1 GNAT superfamily N-acetyltransferase [Geodermatophilus bullaregiensis]